MYNPIADGIRINLGLDLFAEGFTEDELSDAYYNLVSGSENEQLLCEAASFGEINDYYNQLAEGLMEYVGPLVEPGVHEKPLSIALREIHADLLEHTEGE